MKSGKNPDPNVIHPIPGYDKEIYVKPTITNPNIIVGEYTYGNADLINGKIVQNEANCGILVTRQKTKDAWIPA